jgi:hypothetical protein
MVQGGRSMSMCCTVGSPTMGVVCNGVAPTPKADGRGWFVSVVANI